MVNNPNSVPPPGHGPKETHTTPASKTEPKNTGSFAFKKDHTFLHMKFTAKQWNKLMNIMLKNLSSYINKTFQKMTAKLKKDWARGEGKDVSD
ncbi:MAG: hypothetical protein COT85_07775 [Chlamydiae bacterium CG10_big_fil_rev_8_21_14_0_10_42_34]|nr:MAG: hypothetical protein COT85_07775 [Chlamydiae bacterium CG10_big_fil_rev_8_21_14_0_10_42_34]